MRRKHHAPHVPADDDDDIGVDSDEDFEGEEDDVPNNLVCAQTGKTR
jgi:hypothetical protein